MNLKEYRAIFPGLYGDVVTEDIYRLRELDFQPAVIFDIGANIGYFTQFAHDLYPDARIVAVEPNLYNHSAFIDNCGSFATIHQAAIGKLGNVLWRATGAVNGAHETYITEGLGYPSGCFEKSHFKRCGAPVVTLAEVVGTRLCLDHKCLIKIDCEGGENSIFTDPQSMKALAGAEYIAAELHYHCDNGGEMHEVIHATTSALLEISRTHDCESKGPMFYARKKQ